MGTYNARLPGTNLYYVRVKHFVARSCVDMAHTKFLTISVIRTLKTSETYLLFFVIYLKFYFRFQTLCDISESIHYYESKNKGKSL